MNTTTTAFFTLTFLGFLVGMAQSFSTVLHPTAASVAGGCSAFVAPSSYHQSTSKLYSTSQPNDNDDDDDEAEKLKKRATELRDQIRKMEEQLGGERKRNYELPKEPQQPDKNPEEGMGGKSLRRKRVLVVGANGRLGSMVCRYLLRNNKDTEVVAAVHYVGEQTSYTSRGYGRLSYEVGAEDGVGNIGPAWSAEDRVATFEYDNDVMKDYNLQNLRVVEVELMDPLQCATITEDVDSVIWCATDFNGNKPRAVSGLNIAFLFRAVADPTKGRVEIEGLQNILGGLKKNLQDRKWKTKDQESQSSLNKPSDPINFVLVSTAPAVFEEFETPFGEFNGLKRQAEQILKQDFPSLSQAILQFGKYEDNFVEEGMEVLTGVSNERDLDEGDNDMRRLRINRRDAARAAVDALTDETLEGKTVKVWTALRG